jgi:flagellar motor switch protein FliN/FliY
MINNNDKESSDNMDDLLSQFDATGDSYGNEDDNKSELLLDDDAKVKNNERPASAKELEAVYDVPVQISAVLGRSTMPVHQLLKLGRGAVVELDRRVGEAIDIYVNNRLVARGEVVVVDDHLGVTMTEIIKSDRS